RLAPAAHAFEAGAERPVVYVDVEPDDVYGLVVAPGHGDLDAADELHAELDGDIARLGDAGGFIVVGQRDQFDAMCMRTSHHVGRTLQPVRVVRMAMQVCVHFNLRGKTRLSGPRSEEHTSELQSREK